MRANNAFLFSLLALVSLHCSDPPSDPSCSFNCDSGAPDSGEPDSGAPDGGSHDGLAPTDDALCTIGCDGGAPEGGGSGSAVDAVSYELVGRFDWASKKLIATERVTLALLANVRSVELDSAVDVKGVTSIDGQVLPFVSANGVLRIDLSPLPPNTDTTSVSFRIEYEAAPSEGLVASTSRDDDPVTSRVVYTDSEPFFGRLWLPAIHKPSDRAQWTVELTVPSNEDVIANGTRTKDDIVGGERVVRYEMDMAIPTYTMAFAAGELEHRDLPTRRVPLSVWYRRGLAIEPNDMLSLVGGAMDTFENLVGPYPWPSYAVVLLPEFSGGMENTTITFTTETSGQANPGTNLQAHELAHQWFGDWVTVKTFDDVWIKEGMATLLAPEAERTLRDAEGKGRLFGIDFAFNAADAIRDTSLVGLAKYTSGPYARGAWLITQIRDRVGEATFWKSLRQVLSQHALGSIDSESFVRSFGLDEATIQKVLHALDEKRVPAVSISMQVSSEGTQVTFTLSDPGGTVITPTVITVVDGVGQPTSSRLTTDAPLTVAIPTGAPFLALDATDVHPEWFASFTYNPDEYQRLLRFLIPTSAPLRTFSTRSAAEQERALDNLLAFRGPLQMVPEAFPLLYAGLHSSYARRFAELAGCYSLAVPDTDRSAWSDVLRPILSMPSRTLWSTAHASCGTDFATSTFGAEFTGLARDVDARSASRFVYLSGYDYGAASTLDALSQTALQAPSLQLRNQAINRLSFQTSTRYGYSAIPVDQVARWKDFFRARLTDAKSVTRFQMVWRGVNGLNDDLALPVAASKLHALPLSDTVQRTVVCDAYRIAQFTRPAAWTEFQQAAQPWDTLGAPARAMLMANGSGCNTP